MIVSMLFIFRFLNLDFEPQRARILTIKSTKLVLIYMTNRQIRILRGFFYFRFFVLSYTFQ